VVFEIEIDETTYEDMGYDVKAEHIPKGHGGGRFWDRL